MIKLIETDKEKVLGLEVTGKINKQDYELINPKIDNAIKKYGKINLYLEIKDLEGFTPKAAWEDFKEIKHWNEFEKIAIIGKDDWETMVTGLTNLVIPGEVRYFDFSEKHIALDWIN
ncbi:MAG: STAS/SEC14 domain-containing protein [Candidatus Cyclobacteriaceae bacterium M3_2C_046]